jgi:hypothetical protein
MKKKAAGLPQTARQPSATHSFENARASFAASPMRQHRPTAKIFLTMFSYFQYYRNNDASQKQKDG